jgi:hypothetical protein
MLILSRLSLSMIGKGDVSVRSLESIVLRDCYVLSCLGFDDLLSLYVFLFVSFGSLSFCALSSLERSSSVNETCTLTTSL